MEVSTVPAMVQQSYGIESDHKEFRQISDSWAQSLKHAFHSLPAVKI